MMSFTVKKGFSNRILNIALLAIITTTPLTACDLAQNYLKADRDGNAEVQDYRDSFASRLDENDDAEPYATSGAPDLQPYIAQSSQKMKSMPLVSVSVNQTVPLRDVLYELAEQAEYDLELDPKIRGAIIFTARNRPFDVVVERIAEIAGLRYKFKDDVLRVEVDTPYNKLYKIDYLSYIRNASSTVSSNISVVSGDGADTGSGFSSSSETEINFWGEVEANLEQVLGWARSNSLATGRSPRITATAANPDVETVAPADGEQQYSAPEATLNVGTLPLEEEEDDSNDGEGSGFSFSLNKHAGLINVFANERAHKEIQEYLKELKKSVASQVLIEAKILEVQLNDEFSAGVDWNYLSRVPGVLTSQFGAAMPGTGPASVANATALTRNATSGGVFTGNNNFVLNSVAGDFDVLLQALSGFGTVKALASPRLTVLNNQPAILNVSTNRVFFEVDIDVSNTDAGVQTDISSTSNSVPEGVIVNVQPSIDMEDRTVSMAVRPTITEVVGTVPDPAVQYITAANAVTGVESTFPELNVQEIDSVIQVRSGEPVVMGGLLQDRSVSTTEGVPVLSEIPLAGALFREQNDLIQKTEIVIFLKATILGNPGDSIHSTDKDFYRKYSADRRPLKF